MHGGFGTEIHSSIKDRAVALGMEQALAALLQMFQGDLFQLVLGKGADRLNNLKEDIFRGKLGIHLNAKLEANKEFEMQFECIFAHFDT